MLTLCIVNYCQVWNNTIYNVTTHFRKLIGYLIITTARPSVPMKEY